MFITCECNHCSGHIEFEAENAGETVACPHCGLDTVLFIRRRPAPPPRKRFFDRPSKRAIWLAVAIVATTALVIVGARVIEPVIETVLPAIGSVLGLVLALVVCVLVIMWAVLWILFPVFVYFQLRKTILLLTQIEANSRPALRIEKTAAESRQ
jgi:DNA-directed RNA polymerase subunit RPC12/RpoP